MSLDSIVFLVKFFFFVGLAGMLVARIRVLSYNRNLKQYKRGEFKEKIREKGEKISLKDPKKKGDPLDDRCVIFEEVLADANGACRLPELHDLNEYSLQREFASLPPSLLRIIISFLLIVGILGTLTGVEELLKSGDINIAELPKALRPSLFAVGGTVLLLWARGVYDYAFRKYLNQLNTFTVEKLIPALLDAIHSTGSLSGGEFQTTMKKFNDESIEELSKMSKTLVDEKELHSAMIKKLDAAADGIAYMTEHLEENERVHGVLSEQHQSLLSEIQEMTVDIGTKLNILVPKKDEIEHITEVSRQLVEGTGKQIKDVMEAAKEIPAFAEEMREYSENLRQMCEKRKKLVASFESFEVQVKELAELNQSVPETIEKPARDGLDKLQAVLKDWQDQQKDFEVYLKGYDDEIKNLFASIEKSVDDFERKSYNDLVEVLDERTKKLGI